MTHPSIKNPSLMSHTAFLCLLAALGTSCSYNLGGVDVSELWGRRGDCALGRRCRAASSDWSVLQTQLLCVGRHLDAKKNQDSLSPVTGEGELCIWPSDPRAASAG